MVPLWKDIVRFKEIISCAIFRAVSVHSIHTINVGLYYSPIIIIFCLVHKEVVVLQKTALFLP